MQFSAHFVFFVVLFNLAFHQSSDTVQYIGNSYGISIFSVQQFQSIQQLQTSMSWTHKSLCVTAYVRTRKLQPHIERLDSERGPNTGSCYYKSTLYYYSVLPQCIMHNGSTTTVIVETLNCISTPLMLSVNYLVSQLHKQHVALI